MKDSDTPLVKRIPIEGQEMWKKIAADIKAAVILIATEDAKALRTLVKNIAELSTRHV